MYAASLAAHCWTASVMEKVRRRGLAKVWATASPLAKVTFWVAGIKSNDWGVMGTGMQALRVEADGADAEK